MSPTSHGSRGWRSHRIVLTVFILMTVICSVLLAPTFRSSALADPSGRATHVIADDEPPTTEEIDNSRVATRVFGLPSDLGSRFPNAYGGIRAIDNSTLVISIVESPQEEVAMLMAYVDSIVDDSIATVGKTIDITFETASVNFRRRQEVVDEIGTLIRSGGELVDLGLAGVGLDAAGIVVDTTRPGDESLTTKLQNKYPDIRFSVRRAQTSTLTATRYADYAPWNGGDALAFNSFGSAAMRCTSGPGAHDASGNRFLLFAGHCGSATYYNTNFAAPSLTNPVGPVASLIFADNYPDIARIAANSSRYFWQGAGNGVRQTTVAPVDPVVGYSVCGQGAVTAAFGGTNCGTISSVNNENWLSDGFTLTYLVGWFIWDGSASMHGDSGGAISMSTIYGFGSVGTITAANSSGSPPYSIGTPTAFHRYIWGLTLNTPSTP